MRFTRNGFWIITPKDVQGLKCACSLKRKWTESKNTKTFSWNSLYRFEIDPRQALFAADNNGQIEIDDKTAIVFFDWIQTEEYVQVDANVAVEDVTVPKVFVALP